MTDKRQVVLYYSLCSQKTLGSLAMWLVAFPGSGLSERSRNDVTGAELQATPFIREVVLVAETAAVDEPLTVLRGRVIMPARD